MSAGAVVTLTRLVAADHADWRRLWTHYLDFYETKVSEDVYQTAWERLLSDDPHEFHGVIARRASDGAAIGLVHYLFHRHGWKIEPIIYLQDLFVDEAARGLGVGRQLIEHVYAEADRTNASGVYWMTQDFNKTARQLYDRIGQATPFIKYARP